MSMCASKHGGSKVGHPTRQAAEEHRVRHQKTTNILVQTYKCYHCELWHVGRQSGVSRRLKMREKHEEIMVGKLIPLIRNAIEQNND